MVKIYEVEKKGNYIEYYRIEDMDDCVCNYIEYYRNEENVYLVNICNEDQIDRYIRIDIKDKNKKIIRYDDFENVRTYKWRETRVFTNSD